MTHLREGKPSQQISVFLPLETPQRRGLFSCSEHRKYHRQLALDTTGKMGKYLINYFTSFYLFFFLT